MANNKYFSKKKIIAFFSVILSIICSFLINDSVIATNDVIYDKALASSLIDCYDAKVFKDDFTLEDYEKTSGTTEKFMKTEFFGEKVPLPNGYWKNDKLKCNDFVKELLKKKSITVPTSDSEKETDFLTGMGYNVDQASTGKCVYYNYKRTFDKDGTSATVHTGKVCAETINSDGTIGVDKLKILDGEVGIDKEMVVFRSSSGQLKIDCKTCDKNDYFDVFPEGTWRVNKKTGIYVFEKDKTKWSDLVRWLTGQMEKHPNKVDHGYVEQFDSVRFDTYAKTGYGYQYSNDNPFAVEKPYGEENGSIVLGKDAKQRGTKYVFGVQYQNKPTFSQDEVFVLYQNYLKNYYEAEVVCPPSKDMIDEYENSNSFTEIRYYTDGEIKNKCFASAKKHEDDLVNGMSDGKTSVRFGTERNFQEIADWLKNSTVTKLPDGVSLPVDTSSGEENSGGILEEVKETCRNQGGARKMGWILCSVMELAGEATDYIYEKAVEPALRVDTGLFTAMNEENAAKRAWETFRDIANVIFVILLLVVIFSQLTGVGIDNYGIKKILPKLIVAAILINLSYLICLIMVDISNIVGNGFQALFNSIGEGLNTSVAIDGAVPDGSEGGSEFVSTTGNLIGVGLLGTVVFMTGHIWATPAVVLSLLTTAVGMLVAIVFLFFLLAARQAAIIILVTLSPIAIVCYILPNTKGIFDKWINLFKALLLVYPIAGLLVGGGNYVSKVILNMGGGGFEGFWLALIAMLSGIVPIFFLPNVVKGAFKMMGNLGAALTSAGDKLRGGVNKAGSAVGRSEKFRDIQAESNRNRQLRNAERTVRRLEGRDGLSARQTRRLARNTAVRDKLRNEDTAAATLVANQKYANSTQEQIESEWDNAFNSGDANGDLDALTNVMISRFGAGGANAIAKRLATKNIVGNQNAIASMNKLRQNMQVNSNFSQLMRSKASDAFQMISNGGVSGGTRENPEYSNLDYFTEHNNIAKSDADWATQSSATIERAMNAGTLSTTQAERILNSEDKSLQSSLDDEKRMMLQAGVYNISRNPSGVGPNLSPEIASSRYVAEQQAAANTPTIRSSGAYTDPNGVSVQLHEMSDGTFVNAENNQVVDIRQYKRK